MKHKSTVLGGLMMVLSILGTNALAARLDANELSNQKSNATTELASHIEYTAQPSEQKQQKEIPIPAAAWLFGSALLGFVKISNRRHV